MKQRRVFFVALSLLLRLFLGDVVSAEEDTQRYRTIPHTVDHPSPGDLNFLVGIWESCEKSDQFSETWSLGHDGALIGFRKDERPLEYDFFAFEPNRLGLTVRMKRMEFRFRDLNPDRISGAWSSDTTNRCELAFSRGDYSMISKYDSPSPDLLDIEIDTRLGGKESKRLVHLHRRATEKHK